MGVKDVMSAKIRFFCFYRTLCNIITRRILTKDDRDITHKVKDVTLISKLLSILFIFNQDFHVDYAKSASQNKRIYFFTTPKGSKMGK